MTLISSYLYNTPFPAPISDADGLMRYTMNMNNQLSQFSSMYNQAIQAIQNNWGTLNSASFPVPTILTDYTILTGDRGLQIDATAGNMTLTLPDARISSGMTFLIVRIDATANTVTLAASNAQTVNGAASQVIAASYGVARPMSTGLAWLLI